MEYAMKDYTRQSFLGDDAQNTLTETCIGLIGYSGGGSHFGQQFGHAGIGRYIVVDPKNITATHRPRFVGSEPEDVNVGRRKVDIAERQIKRGNPTAIVEKFATPWQEATDALLECDILYGAVDSYRERDEIERFCRRNMIPLIDIGMDVRSMAGGQYSISGQIIQSLPGGHCMRCCNFITDEKLTREAETYGDAGPAPQVIWANGVLASTAVGWGISLLCPWRKMPRPFRWLSYDGDTGELKIPAIVEGHLSKTPCMHYPIVEVGDPLCDIRKFDLSLCDVTNKDAVLSNDNSTRAPVISNLIFSIGRLLRRSKGWYRSFASRK